MVRYIFIGLVSLFVAIIFSGCTDEEAKISAYEAGSIYYDENGTLVEKDFFPDIHLNDDDLIFVSDGWSQDSSTYKDGNSSAKSKEIYSNEKTCIQTIVEGTGTLSFYWKVSSESGYDYLKFYVDNIEQGKISGSKDWVRQFYNQYSNGRHIYKWCYEKDTYMSKGSDTSWIDNIKFTKY
jgi:hypothetical protein